MISERALRRAVELGVVSADQAEALQGIERQVGAGETADEERLRFIAGFGDIFVTIGIVLFLGALGHLASGAGIAALGGAVAIGSWALAEFFTRRRRMALPSIVLLLAFCGGIFVLAFPLATGQAGPPLSQKLWLWGAAMVLGQSQALIDALLVTVVAAGLYYARFRVPITVAAGVAALIGAFFAGLGAYALNFLLSYFNHLLLASGILVFALAMSFDMADPRRLTRRADIAFWLHLLAAPLVVHPLIGGFIWRGRPFDSAAAFEILLVFLALAVVAVTVDRRALLVSGLSYAGLACFTLLQQSSLGERTVPATLFVLGAFILLISAGWRPLRNLFLAFVPKALASRLPNPGLLLPS